MANLFDEISSSDADDFRENFTQFLLGKGLDKSTKKNSASQKVKIRLLDLLLNPESGAKDDDFRGELQNVIERISEINILDTPGIPAATSDILEITFEYKNQILKHLDNNTIPDDKKTLWRRHINEFFDNFILELVRRWESFESERYIEELERAQTDKEHLEKENNRLKGIYALSIEIAKIANPNEIYGYLAQKLPSILAFDNLIILDASTGKIQEQVFPVNKTSLSEINAGRNKIEDVYELFQRIVIIRDLVETQIHDIDKVDRQAEHVDAPESVFVPMLEKDYTWGIIGVLRRAGHPFNSQEVQSLSIVTSLVDQIVRNINVIRRERTLARSLDDQLKIAKSIQINVLPDSFKSDQLTIETRFKPSETISGDFYQFFKTNTNDSGVVIGDVTGHGVAAGLLMMTVMGILTEVFAIEGLSITQMLQRANQNLSRIVNEEFFVTALALWISPDNKLRYFNAGHPPGLLYRKKTGDIIELYPDAFPLGIFEDQQVTAKEVPLDSSDRILLYTDGLIEAKDKYNTQFGIDKLKALFMDKVNSSCDFLLDEILDAVYYHAGTDDLRDDVALVLIENK